MPVTRTSRSRLTPEPKCFSRNGPSKKCLEAVFCLSEVALFQKHRKTCFSKKVQLLRSCAFDFSELGVLLLRSCVMSLPHPPLHSGPSLHHLLSETCQNNGVFLQSGNPSCHEIRSSRTSVGGQISGAGPGRSDLVARRVARLKENATLLTCFAENFFVILLATSQPDKKNKQKSFPCGQYTPHTAAHLSSLFLV